MTPDSNLEALFKYRSATGRYGMSAISDIILRNRMFWQSPDQFNDPFDCFPDLTFGPDPARQKLWILQALERLNHLPRHERRRRRRHALEYKKTEIEATLKESWRVQMTRTAVSCFSRVGDHPLMWGHYASGHTGVCFHFREQLSPSNWFGFPVHYSTDRPIVDMTSFGEGQGALDKSILTKSIDWSYEQEVRMIEYGVTPGLRSFPPCALEAVVLGCRISSDNERSVLEMVGKRSRPLAVFRAEQDVRKYALNIQPI